MLSPQAVWHSWVARPTSTVPQGVPVPWHTAGLKGLWAESRCAIKHNFCVMGLLLELSSAMGSCSTSPTPDHSEASGCSAGARTTTFGGDPILLLLSRSPAPFSASPRANGFRHLHRHLLGLSTGASGEEKDMLPPWSSGNVLTPLGRAGGSGAAWGTFSTKTIFLVNNSSLATGMNLGWG